MTSGPTAITVDLRRMPYREAYEIQRLTRRAILEKGHPDTLLLVEHPPVITLGKRAKDENLLLGKAQLRSRGVDLVEVERGGDVTYHGPGQLVAYPIFRIGAAVHDHVAQLAEAARRTCLEYGASPRWDEARPGLWVGGAKIAAIGVHVHRGVSLHGLALNVNRTALEGFQWIVPCGLRGVTLTCLQDAAAAPLDTREVGLSLALHLGDTSGRGPFTFSKPLELFSRIGHVPSIL